MTAPPCPAGRPSQRGMMGHMYFPWGWSMQRDAGAMLLHLRLFLHPTFFPPCLLTAVAAYTMRLTPAGAAEPVRRRVVLLQGRRQLAGAPHAVHLHGVSGGLWTGLLSAGGGDAGGHHPNLCVGVRQDAALPGAQDAWHMYLLMQLPSSQKTFRKHACRSLTAVRGA